MGSQFRVDGRPILCCVLDIMPGVKRRVVFRSGKMGMAGGMPGINIAGVGFYLVTTVYLDALRVVHGGYGLRGDDNLGRCHMENRGGNPRMGR